MTTLTHYRGLTVYRTDEDGRVTVESDGERFSVQTER
jgi:beta-lactamase superfamily II metal-dependent hydrolase